MAVVLITGCSSGFGYYGALAFARNGDTVYACVRDSNKADSLLEKAADTLVAQSNPPGDVRGSTEFKRNILKGLFVQAAERALSRAKGEQIVGSHNYV